MEQSFLNGKDCIKWLWFPIIKLISKTFGFENADA